MKSDSAAPRFNPIDRRQMLLRPVNIEDLIDEEHPARAIWDLIGSLDLTLYYQQIQAVAGHAGRPATDPQLLISLWLYAYSRGISSAREISRQCGYEPGFQWLCALETINYHTLSDFRTGFKGALDDLFGQVLGMLSAEGLIELERVTQDGTKIRANAGNNTFRRAETLAAHLALAEEQVRLMDQQAEQEERSNARQSAARQRALRERQERLRAATREVERMQKQKKEDRKHYVARASTTDPEARMMRTGEGIAMPAFNVQTTTDAGHGFVVGMAVTSDANDYRQLVPAMDRMLQTQGCYPKEMIADGDYTNHANVQAAAECGVDFYGSWKAKREPGEVDAQGRGPEFQSEAFVYDEATDQFTCPAGQSLPFHYIQQKRQGAEFRMYRPAPAVCRQCARRSECAPANAKANWSRLVSRQVEAKAVTEFKAKMATEAAQKIYRVRSQIAEFPHAWIKQRCGVRQFRCRGLWKVACEALWACLSYNLSRWFALRRRVPVPTTA